MYRSMRISLGLAALAAAAMACAGGLGIGSKAPEIKAAKWLNGKPVAKFEKGQIYVVEFWATWCGPCKQSIPHLNEMSKGEFKDKVKFIGVSVWERAPDDKTPAYMDKVSKFVKDMGAGMSYSVAIDGLDDFMSKNWMQAAGQNGIPAAFIVNGEGQIAWIGHPMNGLDETLRQILAGKYDMKGAAAKLKKEQEMEEAMMSLNQTVGTLMAKGDYKGAVDAFEKGVEKLEVEPEVRQQMRANFFNQIAWDLLTNKKILNPDYRLALEVAEKAVAADPENGLILDTLALANFKNGNKEKAIAIQEKAIALVKAMKNADAETLKEMEERLAEFKKG